MTEWHAITAKFTTSEKKVLDKLHDVYGFNYNQSLKLGVEFFARILAMCEMYVATDNKTIKKIDKIGKKYNKNFANDVKKILMKMPAKEQLANYTDETGRVLSEFDNIFVKNRRRGRKSLPRKRGRPKDTGKTS